MQQQLKSLLTWSPGPDDLPPFRRARAAYGESVAMAAKLYSKPIPDETPNQQADRTKSGPLFDHDVYAEVKWRWTGGEKERIEVLACGSDWLELWP